MELPVIFALNDAQTVISIVVVAIVTSAVGFYLGNRFGLTRNAHRVALDESAPATSQTSHDQTNDPLPQGPNVFGQTDYPEFRKRLREVLDQIGQGVIIWAEGGDEIYRNAQARRFLEARDSLVLVEIAVQDLRERIVGDVAHAGPVQEEVELIGPPVQVYVVTLYPFIPEVGGQGALVIIEDASAQRRIDTVRRDFVANISHELKTPIGALELLSETILDEEDDEVIQRLTERLVVEANRAGRTVDDLLELSQIEFGDETEFAEVNVEAIICEALSRLGGALDQSNVGIDVNVDASLHVIGNYRQLVSAMYNLIDNALKYSPEGSLVQVSSARQTTSETDEPQFIEISIADTGIGIPRRDLDRIFERFYRVDRARARSSGGTGLGLAIVRHIISNHGGVIDVSSVEGVGSTFILTLKAPETSPPSPTDDAHGDDSPEYQS